MSVTVDERGTRWDWAVPVGSSASATIVPTEGGSPAVPSVVTTAILDRAGAVGSFTVTSDATSVTISLPSNLPQGTYRWALVADGKQWFTGDIRITAPGDPQRSPSSTTVNATIVDGPTVAVTITGPPGPSGGGGSGDSGTPAVSVVSERALNDAAAVVGASTNYARQDHSHGTPPMPSAADVGADAAGTAASAVSTHNALGTTAHGGIVASDDARLTNARTPTAHATSHATGGTDPITPASIGAATAAQGSLADTATQPGDLATVAATGAYGDLSGRPTLGTAAAAATTDFAPIAHVGAGGGAHANAVASGAAGFLSGADKAKLDGIEAGADVTPSLATVATTGVYSDLSGTPDLSQYATLTPTVGTGLGTTGTVNLDMAALTGTFQTIAVSGDITFTTSNRATGRTVTLRLTNGATSRTLTYPAGWVVVGSALPATIQNATVVLTITFFGTADTDAVVAAAVSV